MSRPVFLSYRRSDSAEATSRLYEAVRQRFGTDSVYMDSSSTAWGEAWPTALESAISGADAVVVVIGPSWLSARDEWGRRRIDRADDWVRREIELALRLRKTILPLLVGGTEMPPQEALPEEIEELATKHAFSLPADDWEKHVEAVLDNLATHVVSETKSMPRESESVAEQFQNVAARFYTAPVDERMAAAEEIAGIGGLLTMEQVLRFAGSRAPSERVGAAIALAAHLRASEQPREEPRVQAALRALLNDNRSRVRYRAVEVLSGFPALVPAYLGDLSWRAANDQNEYVKRMAQTALQRSGH